MLILLCIFIFFILIAIIFGYNGYEITTIGIIAAIICVIILIIILVNAISISSSVDKLPMNMYEALATHDMYKIKLYNIQLAYFKDLKRRSSWTSFSAFVSHKIDAMEPIKEQ